MHTSKTPPSQRWTSYEGWAYNGMKERLQTTLDCVNKSELVRHAEKIKGQKLVMSDPFSAGQSWICFELVAEDESLVIARVRLPRHPNTSPAITDDDETYAIGCEVTAMDLIKRRLPHIPIPHVYAYEARGSQRAKDVGAVYMLLEGFYGNTLQDSNNDICALPLATQEHIMGQWTSIQAEIATITCSQIGSIYSISETGDPVIGRLTASAIGEVSNAGPFSETAEYFIALANASVNNLNETAKLGAYIFRDIVNHTRFFSNINTAGNYPLSHMDLGTQNILVDDNYNIIAIIDWEFAQTVPWQVNHFPMPFPLLGLDIEDILREPSHLAYANVTRQHSSRQMYMQKFEEAERALLEGNRCLRGSFAEVLRSPASRIYACFTTLGRNQQADADLTRQMVRLAFGFQGEQAEKYIQDISLRL